MSHAELEALLTRCKRYENRGLRIWDDGTKKIIDATKQIYLKHLVLKTDQTRSLYKLRCTFARRESTTIKRNGWNKCISDIEHDVQGSQDKTDVYKRQIIP